MVCLLLDYNEMNSDGSLIMATKEAIKWMLKKVKPWMSQLAAVTYLSLAAKVEETQAPLLLYLQVEESKHLFHAKTIQRMELLVLSTLKWKMNPVTQLILMSSLLYMNWMDDFSIIISAMVYRCFLYIPNTDHRLVHYLPHAMVYRCFLYIPNADHRLAHFLPSVIAGATMIYVTREIEPCNAMKYKNQLMDVLKISKEEMAGDDKPCLKHKLESVLSSPYGVIDVYFSSGSSRDSWVISSPVYHLMNLCLSEAELGIST